MTESFNWPEFLRHRAAGDVSFPITDEWALEIADEIEHLRKENEALRIAAELDGTMIRTLRAALNGGQQ